MTNRKERASGPYVLWKTWKVGTHQYVRYLSVDSDGIADYETSVHRAKKWKTRRGAQGWLDRRGGYGGYSVTGINE